MARTLLYKTSEFPFFQSSSWLIQLTHFDKCGDPSGVEFPGTHLSSGGPFTRPS